MKQYRTIESAWFGICKNIKANGYTYTIDRGSFEGTQRKQLPYAAFVINTPGARPLSVTYKGQNIITESEIEKYFVEYIMNPELKENEAYTYGQRIAPLLPDVIDMLSKNKNTNQAIIEVAKPEDIKLKDPPCLRSLSWKVKNSFLSISCFFRSWDAYAGLPTNLGGIQLLNEYVALETNLIPYKLICYSDGLHLYEHCWDLI